MENEQDGVGGGGVKMEEITTVERCGRMRETSKRRGRDGRAWSKMDGTAPAIKKPWFFKRNDKGREAKDEQEGTET